MKCFYKFFVVAVFCSAMTTFSLDAQVIKGGLIFGGNLSQVDGDEVYGFKRIGFNVGATAIVPFTEKWSLSIETIFSQEGAYQKGSGSFTDSLPVSSLTDTCVFGARITDAYNLRLNYVRIPILFHYNDRRLSLGVGFQYGRLVNSKENNRIEPQNPDFVLPELYQLSDFSQKNDFSILADVKFRIWKGLYFNARYSYSLVSIRTENFVYYDVNTRELSTDSRKQYNNTITLRLMWIFNDKGGTLKKQGKEDLKQGI